MRPRIRIYMVVGAVRLGTIALASIVCTTSPR
jgi:hypothetical protein